MNNKITFGPTGSVGPIGITGPVGQPGPRGITTRIWNRIIKIKKLKRIWETIRVI
jgi:hypothetical protein